MWPENDSVSSGNTGPVWHGASGNRCTQGGGKVTSYAQLQMGRLRGARIDFDQEGLAGRVLDNKIKAGESRQAQTPHNFFHGSAHLGILDQSYDCCGSHGAPGLQDNGPNLGQDFALPARHCHIRVLAGDELLDANQRVLAPEQPSKKSVVTIQQNPLQCLGRGAPGKQFAESPMGLLACFDDSNALAARGTISLQNCGKAAFARPVIQRTRAGN